MFQLSRRKFLISGVGATLVSFSQLWPMLAQDGDDVTTILNLAATAEGLACTHYYTVLTDSEVQLTPRERAYVVAALDTERQHLDFLTANGGQMLTNQFYMPQNVFRNRENFASVTEQLEVLFAGAYLAAVQQAATLNEAELATTFAQIASAEAVHVALIRQLGDLLPNNMAMAQAFYSQPSQVVPALQPFIEGGLSFSGPRALPNADAMLEVIGDNGVAAVDPVFQSAK